VKHGRDYTTGMMKFEKNNGTLALMFVAFSALTLSPKGRSHTTSPDSFLQFTAISRQIFLIDLTEVKVLSTEVDHGVEFVEKSIRSNVVEVIRGKVDGLSFAVSDKSYRVTDEAVARAHYDGDAFQVLNTPNIYSAAYCKAEHRYLVISLPDLDVFLEVAKDNEEWRKKIYDLDESLAAPVKAECVKP
jgi:hypothetical protein